MGRKAKYTKQQKVQACEDYLSGRKTAIQISVELNMGKRGDNRVRIWAKNYRANGHVIFDNKSTNNRYSKEFKEMIVKEYLDGLGSSCDLSAKYGILKDDTVLNWVKKYNSHRELRDYDSKPEVYMADTLKVSKEKKIEIIKYCIGHDHDYKGTAAFYGGNYAQIYSWVKKYESKGEEDLEDRRGKRKSEEQLTDLEKAQRRIAELERINRRQEIFSIPEQQYLSYMLNDKLFSNGPEIRNKYAHGNYPSDENKHHENYIFLLNIMIMTIVKINEEILWREEINNKQS